MKKVLPTFIILILSQSLFGQHQFGIKLNGGGSQIHRTEENNSAYKTHFKLSSSSGFFYNFNFGKKSYAGIDALLATLQGHEHFEGAQTFNEYNGTTFFPVTITYQSEYYRQITYLAFPVYYGIKLKKISVNIGIQASVILINVLNGEGSFQYSDGRNPTSWKSNKSTNLGTGKIDAGARLGLAYTMTERIWVEGYYYIGNNKIEDNNSYPSKKELIQQITIGLRYSFSKKKTKE